MSIIRAMVIAIVLAVTFLGCGSAESSTSSAPTPEPAATAVPTIAPDEVEVDEPDPTDEPEVDELDPTEEPEPTPEPTPKPTKVSYKKLSDRAWAKLVKSPDKYVGKTYQIWACIFQFDAATGEDAFLGYASNKKRTYWFVDGENASFVGDAGKLADYVEDDAVVMNVTSTGSYSYDTQAGGNTTVPAFRVNKITRKGSCD